MATAGSRFVLQQHFARTNHFDFRLEHEGVFRSWALPKGIPLSAGEARLALETQDHDISFGDYEGVIPSGEYGAGTIRVVAAGFYECASWGSHLIEFALFGQTITGIFKLVKRHRLGPRQWLLVRIS
jgi:bifunctional non-homologous end joining protein LigD